MNRSHHRTSLLLLISMLLVSSPIWGLRVSPGSYTEKGLPVGSPKVLNTAFTLINSSSDSIKVVLEKVRVSAIKKEWLSGYQELPDPTWLHVDAPDTILLGPKAQGQYKVTWSCPASPDLYNQHWIAVIPAKVLGGMFQTAFVPQFFLETAVNDSVITAPNGAWGIVPSALNLPTSDTLTRKLSLRFYNQTSTAVTCTLSIGLPDSSGRSLKVQPSEGYYLVPVVNGVTFPATIQVPPYGSTEVPVTWQPSLAKPKRNSETLLMVRGGKTMRFVRLLLNALRPESKAKP